MQQIVGKINLGPSREVFPDPKPRKRLEDEAFIDFLKTMPCIYQIDRFEQANQPHHDRTGYGDGKGAGSTRPDDYRAIRTCVDCHNSLHSTIGPRYRAMTEKVGREDIVEDQVKNLLKWAVMQGWAMDELYQVILDAIINWIVDERGIA